MHTRRRLSLFAIALTIATAVSFRSPAEEPNSKSQTATDESRPTVQTDDASKSFDWVRVADKAEWQARDSSGELVYKNKLWILGGWFDSFAAPPRDVWSSGDGKSWGKVTETAPWKFSDLPMTVSFNDKMWLMGGWYNGRLEGHGAAACAPRDRPGPSGSPA